VSPPLRSVVSSDDAPKAMGAYSPAIRAGNLLFVSGQIPIEPKSGTLLTGDITEQTEQVMRNITALLKAAGADFNNVVRTTVFLADMNDFAGMNTVYSKHIVDPPPARATVQVARLPRDVKVEIDAIAVLA
jgi:2-iminobutanoate/2-iminopropanoate deaminase